MTQRLYDHDAHFDLTRFHHPPAAFRGAPFWAWNTALDRQQLMRQIDVLQQMGLGGFHIHSRTGLATPYLGDEFLDHVRACVAEAQRRGMRVWLYDEDRWPSGFAGGLVTVDPAHRAKHLLLTRTPYNGTPAPPNLISNAKAGRFENGTLLASYHVVLRDGVVAHYERLDHDAPVPDGPIWYAYLESALPSPWWNNQTYVDTLSPAAIARFIELTHERYAQAVGEQFGRTIPAIFTDEPQFVHKVLPRFAEDERDLFLPWTTDFGASYQAAYGADPLDTLPEIFWELPERRASVARYRYHDHLAERFASSFADTLSQWCAQHNLMLTGHLMEEPTLASQTAALGEAMRSYRSFQLPGIDVLCDRREYTTAKQAQSAAHQFDRPGVASELYGVTNWDFPFSGHKGQGDWQAALGVTLRVHHLSWVSMAGEAKRDYPASIGEQSPWWPEYRLVEDHFARVNVALTRGKARVRIGVIHPIESFWLCYGPYDQTAVEQTEREQQFADLTEWLLFGLLDFDFIAESLLPELCPVQAGAQLAVGVARYDIVLVPGLRTIRSSTLARLEAFHAGGGQLIFAGEVPSLVDALPSDRAQRLAAQAGSIPFARSQVLGALESVRELRVTLASGSPAHSLLHQIREDGDERFVFVCNTDRLDGYDGVTLALRGHWRVALLDTLTGEQRVLPATIKSSETQLAWDAPAHGSLLLRLTAGAPAPTQHVPRARWRQVGELGDPVLVTLSEPNVLLLDQARFQLDDRPWQPEEEILRLDNQLRRELGWPLRMDAVAQPWTSPNPPRTVHTLSLAWTIESTEDVAAPLLALEGAEQATISLNGQPVPVRIIGWWVDQALETVALPALAAGTHELVITRPYGPQTNPEWCYVLGDFGVAVSGRRARIIAPVRSLAWGDWTTQGLPFYAGNLTYHTVFTTSGGTIALRTPAFRAPLLRLQLDGQDVGPVAFAPFQRDLGRLAPGSHRLAITAYGSRVNAFGCVHNADARYPWYGPDSWRTEGDQWAYEYQLCSAGVLVAPRLLGEHEALR